MNAKRVYRVMRVHDLLLHIRPARPHIERRHDGNVAVPRSNQRWCSDGLEFRCDNGEPLRRDVMLAAVDHRFGILRKAPVPIESLSDNG